MSVPVPVVGAMPPVPNRGNSPDLFESRMDAFLAAIVVFGLDVNAVAAWLNDALQAVPMAQETLALVGSYTERHQGVHASAPTLRNDGSALHASDLYFNSSTSQTYAWSGSAWTEFTVSGRFKVVDLDELQTSTYVGSAGESVQLKKTSAPLRVLFPSSPASGDLFRVGNQTVLESHVLNGNGSPVQGSMIDINFSMPRTSVTFEYLGAVGWRSING